MYKYDGKLETSLSEPLLYGDVTAKVYEKEGAKPTTIIRTDQEWGVKINWELKGSLAEYICGEWCIRVCLESIGHGPERNWEYRIPLDPCGNGNYYYDFKFKPGDITADYCSTPYKPVVTVTYNSVCHVPGPIAGFVELPILQFYEVSRSRYGESGYETYPDHKDEEKYPGNGNGKYEGEKELAG